MSEQASCRFIGIHNFVMPTPPPSATEPNGWWAGREHFMKPYEIAAMWVGLRACSTRRPLRGSLTIYSHIVVVLALVANSNWPHLGD